MVTGGGLNPQKQDSYRVVSPRIHDLACPYCCTVHSPLKSILRKGGGGGGREGETSTWGELQAFQMGRRKVISLTT